MTTKRKGKARLKDLGKWVVFNTETGFRLTEYSTHAMAIWARGCILYDQPELRGKIDVKQRKFETHNKCKKS